MKPNGIVPAGTRDNTRDNGCMEDALLPLFPLELVLLPGAVLPLHIFEDRYQEMIGECLRTGGEFGVVQAGDNGILNVGCTAVVTEVVKRYSDGRLDILTAGRRRFEIILLDEQKSYLRAAVSFFDDESEEAPPAEVTAMALAGLKLLAAEEEEPDMAADTPLSFRIGERIPDLSFRQLLLSIRSETERLKQIAAYLPTLIARTRRGVRMKKLASRNGHGMPAGNV